MANEFTDTNITGDLDVSGTITGDIDTDDITAASITMDASGVITLDDGTAALPALTFSGDTDSGGYLAAAGQVGITVGGTGVGTFRSTGWNGAVVGNVTGNLSGNVTGDVTGTLTGAVILPDGSAATPSWRFSTDTNTGGYLYAADKIGFSLGGVAVAFLDNTGGNGIYFATGSGIRVNSGGTNDVEILHGAEVVAKFQTLDLGGGILFPLIKCGALSFAEYGAALAIGSLDAVNPAYADTISLINTGTLGSYFYLSATGITLEDAGAAFRGRLAIPDGTVGAPGAFMASDVDTGFYRLAEDQIGVAITGAAAGSLRSTGWHGNVVAGNGAVGTPSMAFASYTTTGLYAYDVIGIPVLSIALGGVQSHTFSASADSRLTSAATYTNSIVNWYAGTDHNLIRWRAARGTSGSPAYLNSGDTVCTLRFGARDGTGTSDYGEVAQIKTTTTAGHGSASTPGQMELYATLSGDTATKVATVQGDRFYYDVVAYNDINFSVGRGNIPGANYPNYTALFGATYNKAYQFAVDEYIELGSEEILHDWKEGTAITPHVHIVLSDTLGADEKVQFRLYYMMGDKNEVLITETYTDGEVTIASGTAAGTHIYIPLADITMTNYKIGAVFSAALMRIAKTAGGTELTDEPWAVNVGLHYQIDTIGSRTATTK